MQKQRASLAYINEIFNKDIGPTELKPTPFHQALVDNEQKFVEEILNGCCSSNARTRLLNTPVCYDFRTLSLFSRSETAELLEDVQKLLNTRETEGLALSTVTVHQSVVEQVRGEPCMASNKQKKSCFPLCKKASTTNIATLPLTHACLSGHKSMVDLLVRSGCDIFARAKNGDTVLHELARILDCSDVFLVDVMRNLVEHAFALGLPIAVQFIRASNARGERVLDVAAQSCKSDVIIYLLNIEHVYKHVIKTCGAHAHVLYDISDYENDQYDREDLLAYSINANRKLIHKLHAANFFSREPVKSWLQLHKSLWLPAYHVSWVCWLVFAAMYITQLIMFNAAQNLDGSWSLGIITISIVQIVMELIHWILLRSRPLPCNGNPMLSPFRWRFTHMTIAWLQLLVTILQFTRIDSNFYAFYSANILHMLSILLLSLSYMQYMKGKPKVNIILIMISQMWQQISKVFQCMFYIYITFPVTFYILQQNRYDKRMAVLSRNSSFLEDQTEQNSTVVGIPSSTQSLMDWYYTCFLMTFYIMPPRDLKFTSMEAVSSAFAIWLYCFLVLNGLVWVNLMIGVMGERVVEIKKIKTTLVEIDVLGICLYYMRVVKRTFVWKIYKAFRFRRNNFVVFDKERDRVYLSVIQNTTSNERREGK